MKVTNSASLERASNPKDPTPENRSKIFEFSILKENLLECLITLKIDSFVKSLKGLVFLSFGSKIFFPLN